MDTFILILFYNNYKITHCIINVMKAVLYNNLTFIKSPVLYIRRKLYCFGYGYIVTIRTSIQGVSLRWKVVNSKY